MIRRNVAAAVLSPNIITTAKILPIHHKYSSFCCGCSLLQVIWMHTDLIVPTESVQESIYLVACYCIQYSIR